MQTVQISVEYEISEEVFTDDSLPIINFKCRLPKLSGIPEKSVRRIQRICSELLSSYRSYLIGRILPEGSEYQRKLIEESRIFKEYYAYFEAEITENDGETISMKTMLRLASPTHGSTVRCFGFTFSARSGLPLSIWDVTEYIKKTDLLSSLKSSADMLRKSGNIDFLDNYDVLIRRKFNKKSFYLKDNELIVFYSPGDIACEYEGIIFLPIGIERASKQ